MFTNEQQEILSKIRNSTSKQWNSYKKRNILFRFKEDPNFQQNLKEEWINKQKQEVENDPLEDKVFDQNGQLVASRSWKCNARNCSYQACRGNNDQLAIEVSKEESLKLTGSKKYACLKHYIVFGKDSDYCHHFFKEHKKLPSNAKLNLKGPVAKLSTHQARLSVPVKPQPNPENLETLQTEGKKTSKLIFIFDCYGYG